MLSIFRKLSLAGLLLVTANSASKATDYTWNGTSGNGTAVPNQANFSQASNWLGTGAVPVSDVNNTQLYFGGPGTYTNINWDAGPSFSAYSYIVNNQAPGDYNLNANTTKNLGIGAGGIAIQSTGTSSNYRQFIIGNGFLGLTAEATQTWSASAAYSIINVQGSYNNAGFNTTLSTGYNTSSIVFGLGSVISGSGGLTATGPGTVQIQGTSNTYTGSTIVQGNAILDIYNIANGGSVSSIGASDSSASNLVLLGGTLQIRRQDPVNATMSSDRSFSVANGSSTILIDANSYSSFSVFLTGNQTTIATGSTLVKSGNGDLYLGSINAASSSPTGSIVVTGGTLHISGNTVNANLTVQGTTGVLAGGNTGGQGYNGTIYPNVGSIPASYYSPSAGENVIYGTVYVNGGTLAPGNIGSGASNHLTMSVANSVTFANANATFAVGLGGNSPQGGSGSDFYSQLRVYNSAVSLGNATLQAILYYTPGVNDQLYIINNRGGTTTGTFNGLPQGATITISAVGAAASAYTAQISYTGNEALGTLTGGNDVVLYNFSPVPEPAMLLSVVALGAGFFGILRRRRTATASI
ncbi:PEP-CTERM sorting domain-containing protein [Telmatocola sphagniphila]|uniref:PEP-CTERM sorting domain-containing protein n=1 Tax=Telmatocola sphagniphila TaxID=1123043 RepID=A0A8E6ET92_9BACT|nr:PEP-CTERM sorting domain-containing protein [Telmatocola sphagniphila]QVL32149.1 PEP-CTERM sorting domain-containing protein [Telmatocola sphagniphila]